ncbi:MAG: hypothetical protein AABY53_01815 [Bdellovibrionota bacterium]
MPQPDCTISSAANSNLDSVFGPVLSDLNRSRYSAAMMKLTLLSNNYSKDLNFLRLLARTQRALVDFTGLIKTLVLIATITKTSTDYLEQMLVLYSQGRLNEALDVGLHLQDMNQQDMNLPANEQKVLSHCLIKIYLEFGDYEGVHEVVATCNTAEEDDLMLWAMGLVLLASGKKNDALMVFRKSVALNRSNDQAWVSLSLLHEEMGDRELALANLDKAFDANPNNATGLKLLTKWHHRDVVQTNKVMNKVRHYLSHYEFDEEISLCYMQLLKEVDDMNSLRFEVEKLVLHNPRNTEYMIMKKNLEVSIKTAQ